MSLKEQAVSGVKWSGASMASITVFQLVTQAVLARLLTPMDFGLMGMIMVVVGFAQAFTDMGFSNAVIHRQDVDNKHLSSIFWVNVLTGTTLFFLILLIRPLAVTYFKEPRISNYLAYAAFIFLIVPSGQLFSTLLRKELKFKLLAQIEIAGTVIYSISAVSGAIAGYGVLSLILGQIVRSFITVCILFFLFRKTWLPGFRLSIRDLKSYFSFGLFQMGERMVNYCRAHIDYVIIARFLGPVALGYYSLANQVILFPINKINPIITKVSFPTFSRIQDDNPRLGRGYCKAINLISMITFPLLTGVLLVAPELVRLVYGPQWEPAIVLIQIFALVGMARSISNPTGSILLAKGRADVGFYWNVFAVIVTSAAVITGSRWGVIGVATALLIIQGPLFFMLNYIVSSVIELKFSTFLKSMQSPLICSIIMLAGTAAVKGLLKDIDMIYLFVTAVTSGATIYITSLYLRERSVLLEIKAAFSKS